MKREVLTSLGIRPTFARNKALLLNMHLLACPINISYPISHFCRVFHICYTTPAKDSSMLHNVHARSSEKEAEGVHWEAGRDGSNVPTFCFPFPYSTAFHMLLVSKLLGLLKTIRTKAKKYSHHADSVIKNPLSPTNLF